jgi:hypothetical protein
MLLSSDPAELAPRTRKWDAEIDKARLHDTWLAFEADIHQSAALRARVARALDRYGLGTSDIVVDDALDYLTHKELGQAARYFNHAGKAQFNQQQITHAVLSFMATKERQRHLTDWAIHDDDTDQDDETPGTIRGSSLADASRIAPDEYAARRDAARAIRSMIPEKDLELYDLWLAIRENGQRGERGTLHSLRAYAQRQSIALSTVYFRMNHLAQAIQRHPWFDEITRPFRPLRRAA